MAPRTDYTGQNCSVARALEVVGERWTLLILRDAFYGVRRFGDFASHLEIPRAVLSSRLRTLVEEEVLARVPGPSGHDEYELTEKGTSLWTVVRELMAWGDRYYSPGGPRRILLHAADDGVLDEMGRCGGCGELVAPADTVITPGPGIAGEPPLENPLAAAFREPRRVLRPIRPELA
ncbi:MAG TPA: helix-turn-helix domain-containing protein [Solirubrobacteraceae bacterium]|jgi:DNA-binding HxlR family transcriptional regulator|nr:helix-turn-helix domain-containing protein [Solirubrobacteraceae bacterium]